MAITFPSNGPDTGDHDTSVDPVPGSGLDDLVRSEIGGLASEFRRTVDRVGDRINLLVQAELQRALAEVLTGSVAPPSETGPEPPSQPLLNGAANGHVNGTQMIGAGLHEVVAPENDPEVLPALSDSSPVGDNESPIDKGDKSAERPEGPLYEGVVRLQVRASGCTCQSTQFVRAVSRMSELRVLRLVGSAGTGLELLVGLRQSMPLEQVLRDMDKVASVRPTQASVNRDEDGTGEQELAVWLVDAPSSHGA